MALVASPADLGVQTSLAPAVAVARWRPPRVRRAPGPACVSGGDPNCLTHAYGFGMGTFVAIAAACLVLGVVIVLVRSGNRVAADVARAKDLATPRRATVLSSREAVKPSAGKWARGVVRHEVHVRVHVPEGDDFTASNVWRVAPGKNGMLVEGASIAVRVHARHAGIVFPDEPWLEYAIDDYAMKRWGG